MTRKKNNIPEHARVSFISVSSSEDEGTEQTERKRGSSISSMKRTRLKDKEKMSSPLTNTSLNTPRKKADSKSGDELELIRARANSVKKEHQQLMNAFEEEKQKAIADKERKTMSMLVSTPPAKVRNHRKHHSAIVTNSDISHIISGMLEEGNDFEDEFGLKERSPKLESMRDLISQEIQPDNLGESDNMNKNDETSFADENDEKVNDDNEVEISDDTENNQNESPVIEDEDIARSNSMNVLVNRNDEDEGRNENTSFFEAETRIGSYENLPLPKETGSRDILSPNADDIHFTVIPLFNTRNSDAETLLSSDDDVISDVFLMERMEELNNTLEKDPRAIQHYRYSFQHVVQKQDNFGDIEWWGRFMMNSESLMVNNTNEVAEKLSMGIPNPIRGLVWQLLANAKNEDLEEIYHQLVKESSPHEKMIRRDITRTFPSHEFFTGGDGQEALFRVMKSYSLYDKRVGYCQGLTFLVGLFLLHMPEAESFCLLVKYMEDYEMRATYKPSLEGLHHNLYQLDRLIVENLPSIAKHFNDEGVLSTMYASEWFMTFFTYRFPLELVDRMFDVFFGEGITSLFKLCLAVLKGNENLLLKLNFDNLLQ
ncbi:RabGAP/TBC, partial [Rozella allomycis CSF55]